MPYQLIILLTFIILHLILPTDCFQLKLTKRNLVSNIGALKFDPSLFIKISAQRPLGIDLEEISDGTFNGVYISDFVKDGNAEKALRKEFISPKGLYLVEANGFDVRNSDFDSAMSAISSSPSDEAINLVLIDPNSVLKGAAVLQVIQSNGQLTEIKCLKGQRLRSVLIDSKIDLYDLKGKMSNCGGGGLCATCVVKLIVPENDWASKPEFEELKLKRFDKSCRLSCNVIIEGDATIEIKPLPII